MRKLIAVIGLLPALLVAGEMEVKMLPDEQWWGGANFFGVKMPFDAKTDLTIDLKRNNYHNQCASLLLSDKGRVVWSEAQSKITIAKGAIKVESDDKIVLEQGGKSLTDAYRFAMRKWFQPMGRAPDMLFFTAPQLNTWIELTYHQNEKDILAYAQSMLDNGVPAGVLMIDDTWQAGYGDWRFEPSRFQNPKAMMDKLHSMGYKVMLWMCPYVSMDIPAFRRIQWGRNPDDVRGYPTKGGFHSVKGSKGGKWSEPEPKCCAWWNGYSAFLDFSHPNANAWFRETLDGLVRDYGVDGFKFDGADLGSYNLDAMDSYDKKATNGKLNNAYGMYSLKYPLCEFRNAWRMQQLPIVMRLHDKQHKWSALGNIVADMIGAGLLGVPFICPDMVGGGEWTTFIPGSPFDPELFIRSAQIHALCPMMQISASPWRVLSPEMQKVFKQTIAIRQKFAPKFAYLARQAAKDGEPILRNLEYNFPNRGYGKIIDQFMMGDDLIVAPVLEKGAKERSVVLPEGCWLGDDGKGIVGPTTITVATPIERIPHFIRCK